eukprot:5648724-Alexandrium_andersonii.AAC.1
MPKRRREDGRQADRHAPSTHERDATAGTIRRGARGYARSAPWGPRPTTLGDGVTGGSRPRLVTSKTVPASG